MTIKYTRSKVSSRPKFTTPRFGNLLSDTWQGEVDQSGDGTWNGWLFNWSNDSRDEYMPGLKSKGAATRWVNQKLRSVAGVK